MTVPTPFGKSTLNNNPLLADGTDFPCKQRAGVYSVEGANNPMALGSTQPLNFVGSAVHGGGSCQISITYDVAPTKDSVWKVIHSIEGGCPMQGITGNNGDSATQAVPDTFHFTIPNSLPTGSAVLAWTWFNKVGNREMYMNCAPINIVGGSSKRFVRDESGELVTRNATMLMERGIEAYNALPDMFTANIGNGCGTIGNTDVLFPQPGDSVEQLGLATKTALVTPTGKCQAVGTAVGSSGSTASSASAATQAPIPTTIFPVTLVASIDPVATTSAAAAPVPTGASSSQSTGEISVPDKTDPATSGSEFAAGTACLDQEGAWNCINGSFFQRCASGQWSVVQAVAAGTTCKTGISQAINIVSDTKPKRSIILSNKYVRLATS